MTLIIDRHATYRLPNKLTTPVQYAWDMVARDLKSVIGYAPKLKIDEEGPVEVEVRYAIPEDHCPDRPEAFAFRFTETNGAKTLHITAHDDLGLVYGLLEYSRRYLGVDPFWFWMDKYPDYKGSVQLHEEDYDSPASFVRFRGWFVNDEVCLIGWRDEYPPTREVWYPVFEALLRCGGNMVIPGTDLPKHGIHADLASEMGLWVTHHHA